MNADIVPIKSLHLESGSKPGVTNPFGLWGQIPYSLYNTLAGARCRDLTSVYHWIVYKVSPDILVTVQ